MGILLLLALAGSACGEAQHRTFRVNISIGGYPPYLILNPDGSADGLLWEVLQEALKDHEILVYEFPRKRVDGFILEGRVDGTFRAPEWTADADRFIFSEPILEVRDALFSRRADPLVYDGPVSLENTRILTHLGYHYAALEPAFASGIAERHDVTDEEDMFRRLLSGDRFDALVIDERVGRWIIQRSGWNDLFEIHPIKSSAVGYRLMMSPANRETMTLFNTRLETLRESGKLNAILSSFPGP